jgi:very-long-chain enoyl-CoA reductase
MILPETWTPLTIAFYAVFAAFAVLLGPLEYFNVWVIMRYSKFRTEKGVPTRFGMITVYAIGLVTAIIWAWPYLPTATPVQWVVFLAIALHFTRRVLESIFVHKYSGPMEPLTFVLIAITYALIGGMTSALNARPTPVMDFWFYLGILFFVVGEAGNSYHHKLLADLRKDRPGYHIPRGGWFEYATCPHYFFELVAWLGLVLLSRHLFIVLVFVVMIGYLPVRSIKTREWYRQRFPKYPKKRKYMIPFIF